jgi:lipid-binding SYLF domain-containing protein
MLNPVIRIAGRLALAGAVAAMATSFPAWSQVDSDQRRGLIQNDVNTAQSLLTALMGAPETQWFQENIGKAKAVLISPEVLKKARLFKSGAGGRALLIVKGKDGKWDGPAFFALTMPETAFKEGVVVAEVAALVMTDKGMSSLLSGASKIGTDVSVVAGPIGAAAPANLTADIVSYSRTKGAYGVFKLDGTSARFDADWNAVYYSSATVQLKDIVTGEATARESASLLYTVNKAAGGK